jgi:small subunit ribosomal protein S20
MNLRDYTGRALTRVHPLSKLRGLLMSRAEQGVANTKSAEKAARQASAHRTRNVAIRSRMRSAIRKVNDAVEAGKKDDAKASYEAAVPLIDTLVNKKIIHRNQAARHKSRLAKRVRALA